MSYVANEDVLRSSKMSRRKEMMKEVQPPSYLSSSTWLDWLIWLDFNTRFHALDAVIDPDDPRGGPLAPYSLYLLYITHPIRKPCIRLARWKMLEWIMLAVILCNCVALAMETNAPGFNESMLGRQLVTANYFFIAIFTIEMIIKVIALGFIMGEHTYLRNGK